MSSCPLALRANARYIARMEYSNSNGRPFELVHFSIFDVGRAVDLSRLAGVAADAVSYAKRMGNFAPVHRDTPDSLSLPRPLCFPLTDVETEKFGNLGAEAKIYADGAITIVVRSRANLEFADLAAYSRDSILRIRGRDFNLDSWAMELFQDALKIISPAVLDPVPEELRDHESYTAYCLRECPEGAATFIRDHREVAAALLVDAEAGTRLHESQMAAALHQPFSYREDDYAVFDMDRCIIIDPHSDYEDILLIVEHAIYRLLELRALDLLLDSRLEEAEKDLSNYASRKGRKSRLLGSAPKTKFARIQALRFEALFVLENLENSSKIIGDYYLCQIYDRLCGIFNTDGWSRSVQRRLDVLSSIYDMAKVDSSERKMVLLEVLFIVVCVVFPAIQIIQVLLLN